MSAPLVVNTADGVCWTRRTVTSGGIALYAPEAVKTCPDFVMATLAELAEHVIVGAADALPMPVGTEPQPLSADRLELIRRKRSHCEAAQFESDDERLPHVWGPSQYPNREMCQRCTVMREWAEDPEADEVVLLAEIDRLLAERHSTNEALDDAVQELREKEQREAAVTKFVAARAEYITAIRNCHPDNGHDYDRWQGHAAARRQLAELLGLPVAWPAEDAASVAKSADRLTQMLAPTQALRTDDEFGLHHTYRVGRDLPEAGGV
ncbi:hypothetical protein [Streptomyces antibioticus]|uniref:Uncharacterized protein n=1 Tax=Streptomyces antibioticus TaxID=1890 RepID=A0AAE6YCK1_STRAT|nr:hypothetical protein [Streptomyces antibioticus]OOQ47263.1 hypothetical protein AFM16_31435 [Streptomyces antibioticus]QIT47580.1 hypothetical protein HCX60_31985 [Streptomyces antibioticus]